VRDKQFAYVDRPAYTETWPRLLEKFLETTKRPNGHMLHDLSKDIDERLRFCTSILPPDIALV